MSETKFTEGEWSILPIEESKEYIRIRGTSLGGRYKVANVIDLKNHHDKSSWCKKEREESKANAHLIAAAPEMYEMLNRWVNSVECVNDNYQDGLKEETIDLLAKARGES